MKLTIYRNTRVFLIRASLTIDFARDTLEVSLKNSNAKFVNSVLKDDQLYFDKEDFEYLMNEKDISRTEIKVRIFAFSN